MRHSLLVRFPPCVVRLPFPTKTPLLCASSSRPDTMRLFGRSKNTKQSKPAPVNTTQAIQGSQASIELLEKRKVFLQKKIDNEMLEVKKLVAAKNKRGAMMALKRKKTFEQQLEKTEGAQLTLMRQVNAIEDASTNRQVLETLHTGTQAMKTVHGGMTIDDVENIREDMEEQIDISNEISEAISQPFGQFDMDDDELSKELEEFEQQEMEKDQLNVERPMHVKPVATTAVAEGLPSVPVGQPVLSAEEQELKDLEAEMAM